MSDTESTGRREGLKGEFAKAVSPLTDGDLRFQPPFDLSSSAALANNLDRGDRAERLFEVTAARQMAYSVMITEYSPQNPELPTREVINTKTRSRNILIAILSDLIDSLEAEEDQSREEI